VQPRLFAALGDGGCAVRQTAAKCSTSAPNLYYVGIGLRNAHAMEIQARELMERQSERLDDYPDVKAKLSAHLGETNEQLRRLQQLPASVRKPEGYSPILSR
jgi:hypothetical protein